jgi:hypothetical protein
MQLFWEAFPAEGGSARTTYMFAYSDTHPSRPSFERLLDAYFALLPSYQHLPGGTLDSIQFKRVRSPGTCFTNAAAAAQLVQSEGRTSAAAAAVMGPTADSLWICCGGVFGVGQKKTKV